MLPILFKTLLLLASLLSLSIVITTAHPILAPESDPEPSSPPLPTTPRVNDACEILGTSADSEVTYARVAACYNSIPFNNQTATIILESVRTIMDDFYAFRDSALTPALPKPFSMNYVDIWKSLSTLGRGRYRSDYQFHHTLSMMLVSLKDVNTAYIAKCYYSYAFAQPLALFAPVVDGMQIIQVHTDLKNRGHEGCRVQLIDGEDALTYINKWADANTGFSKDPGVRLNNVLATLQYSTNSKSFELRTGEFSLRARLPDKAHVDYKLDCSSGVIYVRDKWETYPNGPKATFNSVHTFVQNVCHAQLSPSAFSNESPPQKYTPFQPKENLYTPKLIENPYKKTTPIVNDPTPPPPVEPTKPDVRFAGIPSSKTSVVFQLKERTEVGVLHIHTHATNGDISKELDKITANLIALGKHGVRKIIIDLQGNLGGDTSFASALVQLFFPNKDKLDKTLPSNLRVTESIKDLTSALFNKAPGALHDASSYYDLATKGRYTNNNLFLNSSASVRNGRSASYSDMATLKPYIHHSNSVLTTMPWYNNSANIILLTDGRCGSACSLSAVFFQKFNKVTTYVIGGITGEPMTASSSPGGAVTSLNIVYNLYNFAKVPCPFKPLPYKGDVLFTALEVFTPGTEIPLDFDAPYLTADHHLDYTPDNARDRMVMWKQVAAAAWGAA
ncbi:MAG: hypothetical protein J3R72DRAFT_428940 [Linnemannia gamsii]|nr:MAG: hypothetical protein J3R72DRAFT_428940 [Linnemannia gamsii]